MLAVMTVEKYIIAGIELTLDQPVIIVNKNYISKQNQAWRMLDMKI